MKASQESKIIMALIDANFTMVKSWLPNAVRVASQSRGASFVCDVIVTRLESGPVLHVDPLPITCDVNLYPDENKRRFAELNLILARLNCSFNKKPAI